jgi:putative ABC transport system permease protein
MIWLACKLVFHNRTRLFVTLLGLVFSAYLTITEIALYIGMMENATSIIRHSGADLWVVSKGIQNFDFAKTFPNDGVQQLLRSRDVLWAKPIMLSWGFLKLPDGAQEQVEIIGYDPAAAVGGPWEMEKGSASDVGAGAHIIIDESARRRLGDLRLGSQWELNDRVVKLVGLSRSAKTFTTAPIIFTSYALAQELSPGVLRRGATAYIAIKLRTPSDGKRVAETVRRDMKDNEILTTDAFVERTILYWTVQTGMGAALCLTAVLGLVVGAGIIGQTVFANTMEHLGEFATLKAMGATGRELNTVILGQAVINAGAGFAIAVLLALLSKSPLEETGITLAVDLKLVSFLLVLTLAIAIAAAYFSIRRVRTLDPATIFRS